MQIQYVMHTNVKGNGVHCMIHERMADGLPVNFYDRLNFMGVFLVLLFDRFELASVSDITNLQR